MANVLGVPIGRARACPKCRKDVGMEARNYYALAVIQVAICPHCGAKLVSDYKDDRFAWFSCGGDEDDAE